MSTDGSAGAPVRVRPRWIVAALAVVFAAQLGYVLYRGATVGIDYYDAYSYRSNARRLLGDESANFQSHRPPLLPILEAPAIAIARSGPPANVVYRLGPHLTGALLSVLTALAVLALLRMRFGTTLGLVGAIAFAANRLYVHYAAQAVTDVLATGCLVATIWLYLRARQRGSLPTYVLAGVALGAAGLARHNLIVLPALLVMSEVVFAVAARRLDDRRGLGLALAILVGQAVLGGTYLVVAKIVTGEASPATAVEWVETAYRAIAEGWPGESRADYLEMAPQILSWPVVILAPIGAAVALWRRDLRDAPIFVWLLAIGGGLVAAVKHTEARFLLPIAPALIWLALRAVELAVGRLEPWWKRARTPARLAVVVPALAVGLLALDPGLEQIGLDADPIYTSDVQRRAALRMMALRTGEGRYGWIGGTHNLMPRAAEVIPLDETFSIYHFDHLVLGYFSDGRITIGPRPSDPGAEIERVLAATGRDGDVYLRAHPTILWTHQLRTQRPPSTAIEIYSVRRGAAGNVVRRESLP